MTCFPKPARRGPKPKRPIKRSRAPRAFRKGAKAAAKRLTKAEWSLAVRRRFDGLCVYHAIPEHRATDAAHIVPVGVRPAMRFHPENGLPLCRHAHRYFTPRPVEWALFVQTFVPAHVYAALLAEKQATA